MGQNGTFASKTRETPAEICVDGIQEEPQLPQGPSDIEAHLSNLSGMNFIDINVGKELYPVIRNHANAVAGEVSLNGDGNSRVNSDGNLEEVRVPLRPHETSKLPRSTGSHVQENLTFPAELLETAQLKGDMTWERANIEDRLNAHFQETIELNVGFRTLFQQWEVRIHELEGLSFGKEKEIAILKGENQQSSHLITELRSRVAQVMKIQATVSEMKGAIENLHQEVRKQPFAMDEYLKHAIGDAVVQLYCNNRALCQNLFKCQTELESAKHSGTNEIKQMEEQLRRLEEVNRKLEQRAEKIQQQLCKERTGQDGSYVDGQQTPSLLESTAKEMFSSIATFCTSLSKHTGPDGKNHAHSLILGSDLWKRSRITREHHWKYMLKKHISDRLFANFEREGIVSLDNSVVFLDPEERVSKCFEYFKSCKTTGVLARAFCNARKHKLDYLFYKYSADSLGLLPPDIESMVCGIFQSHESTWVRYRTLLSRLTTDKRHLIETFMLAAEKVWQFHTLCLSFEPPATIFRVSCGETFNQHYMDGTDALETGDRNSVPRVAFMVYPGFRLRKSIIKCEVYVGIKT